MKQIFLIAIILTLLLSTSQAFGHTTDTTKQEIVSTRADTLTATNEESAYDDTDDFSPGLLFFALIGAGFILICVGAGIVLTTIVLMIVFGFVSLGVLSASIIVGLNKRSFTKGFKTFLISISAIGGLMFWGIAFGAVNRIMHWQSTETAILTGAACGLLAGLVFGFIAFYLLQRLTNYFKVRLKLV